MIAGVAKPTTPLRRIEKFDNGAWVETPMRYIRCGQIFRIDDSDGVFGIFFADDDAFLNEQKIWAIMVTRIDENHAVFAKVLKGHEPKKEAN